MTNINTLLSFLFAEHFWYIIITNDSPWNTTMTKRTKENKEQELTNLSFIFVFWNEIEFTKKIELVQWYGHESIFLHASTLPTLIHNLVWKDQNGENVCKFGRICVRYFFTIYVNGWITIIHSFTTDIVKDTTVNVK